MLSEANVNISVVLVSGGKESGSVGPASVYAGVGSAGKSVELVSSNGTRLCSLPNLPGERWGHSQTGIVTCGGGVGSEETSCVTFDAGSWKKTHTLGQGEWPDHTAWASPQGVMLIRSKLKPRICFRVLGNACRRGSFGSTKTELLTDNGNGGSTPPLNLDYSGR